MEHPAMIFARDGRRFAGLMRTSFIGGDAGATAGSKLHLIWTAHEGCSKASKQGELGMEALINFFTLRPTFTVFGLKVVWYIYLLNAVIQTYVSISGISQVLAQRGIHLEVWSPNFIPLILGLVAQLAIVRLLIEVAAIIISTSHTAKDGR
jgi:hypothetical protein